MESNLSSLAFLGLCMVILSLDSVTRVLSSDLDILKGLSEELKGTGSFWNTSDNNPCSWRGIQCDDANRVTNITLQGYHLKGTISPRFGLLQSLKVLDLSRNSLFSVIPANLSNCFSLAVLNLSSNKLSGSIPDNFYKLGSLVSLDLSVNALKGSIPESLGNMSTLETLDLSFNNLTGNLPAALGNLHALRKLSLSQNFLDGSIPPTYGNLTNLIGFLAYQNILSGPMPPVNWTSLLSLNLASNNLSGELPDNLCTSGQLEVLIVTSNSFSGPLPKSLGSCLTLTSLRVGENNFTGVIPDSFGRLVNLIYFEANKNLLSGEIPAGISGCKNLALLNLASNKLYGEIPDELGNLTSLEELHLLDNSFFGIIPQGLSRCQQLSVLDLSGNRLYGVIPPDLCSYNKLVYLRLQGNILSGEIPSSISDCAQLLELQLGENRLYGSIPSSIGTLSNLQVSLNLSANNLRGTIPTSIGTLSKLVSLDLSHNQLSGPIPSLVSMVSLVDWNFSYNLLSGPVPRVGSVLNSSSTQYASSYSNNPGLCGGPLPPCATTLKEKQKALSFLESISVTVGCLIVVLLVCAGIAMSLMYKRHMSSVVEPAPSPMITCVFVESLKQAVNFESVKEATEKKDTVLSINQFSTMYKALMPSGLVLAAKRFQSSEKGRPFYHSKIAYDLDKAWRLSHKNIMQPIGYILQDNSAIILYDFVPTCNLSQHLHNGSEQHMLSWSMRYQIAIAAAEGLSFLHHSCQPPVVHMDVTSNNIFLGGGNEVKLGDIELTKLLDPSKNTGSISAVAGSFGYIAPEYAFTMQVTLSSNVYSFGVVLLELLTGRLPVDDMFGEGVDLVRWVHGASSRGETPEQILDARISTQSFSVRQEMLSVLKVALLCTDASPLKRPEMRKVLEMLISSKMRQVFKLHQKKV